MKKLIRSLILLFFSTSTFAQGTYLIKDIIPGDNSSTPSNLVKAGNFIYFTAKATGTDDGFYRTDGTSEGTQLIRTVTRRRSFDPYADRNATDFNGRLVFTRNSDNSFSEEELWVTDGTDQGTKFIDTYHRVNELIVFNNNVYFVVDNSFTDKRGLYKWDGTNTPIKIVGGDELNDGVNYSIVVGDNKLFFVDGWRIYDVTNDNPIVIYNQSAVDNSVSGLGTAVFYSGKILLNEGRANCTVLKKLYTNLITFLI